MTNALLIREVRIFDGETEIPQGSVLIEGGKITKVSQAQLEAPHKSTCIVSKPGHTLLPGIIDGHIHADKGNTVSLTQSIKFGVTTVCDMHNESHLIPALRKLAAESRDASDFKTASQAATVENGWPAAVITAIDKSPEAMALIRGWPKIKTQADIDAWIKARVEDKADYVKLMHEDGAGLIVQPNYPSFEIQAQIVKAAHKHGFLAVAHALSRGMTIEALNAGVDGMTHTFCDLPPSEEVIEAYKKNNAHCNPTLAAIGSLTKEGRELQEAYAHDPRVSSLLSEDGKRSLCSCMALGNDQSRVENAYQSVRELKAAGIDIILGSDSAGPALGTAYGVTAHQEMALLVNKCGFTPTEALRAGTSIVSKRLGLTDRGRIAEGLRADLVLVEGNPLEDIDKTLDLRAVWKKGDLCSIYQNILT